tara:strand:- start:258 stop:1028 length:771 start_codon:yes stop_codon:yes gene_type:complete
VNLKTNWKALLKKAFLALFALLFLIIVSGGIHLYINAEKVIRNTVKEVGAKATGTKVTVRKVELSFHEGELVLAGIQVENVKPFKSNSAIKIGSIGLKMKLGSLTSNAIVIDEIIVSGLDIAFEYIGGRTNFSIIRDRVIHYCNPDKRVEFIKDAEVYDRGFKFITRTLFIRDGRVNVSSDRLSMVNANNVQPKLRLKKLTKEGGGITPHRLICDVTTAILDHVFKTRKSKLGSVTGKIISDDIGPANNLVEEVNK